MGIETVAGSLDDRELLSDEARRADGVINAASSDHRAAVEALIEGLAGSGKALIHTSGSSLVGVPVAGARTSDVIFTETDPLVIGPDKRDRHAIDCMVLQAPGMRGIVLCNSLIYGVGKGLQPHSVQIPPLVHYAEQTGSVRVVGLGLNRWSTVHIDDMCDLYRLALEQAPGGAFYFVENGEASFSEIADALADRLALPRGEGWTEGEAIEIWGYNRARYSLGCDSRVRAERARRELHWRPRHDSALRWIREEMPRAQS